MSDKPGRGRGATSGTTGDLKNKSRLAALAPGENLKEKQVCLLSFLNSLQKM